MSLVRSTRLLCLLAACLSCCGGCSVWHQVYTTVSHECAYQHSERELRRREARLAEAAWQAHAQASPNACCSPEFADGFKDGFARYLHTGCPDPPAAAPEKYLRTSDLAAIAAAKEWFAGFHTGVEAARSSGQREALMVPILIGRPLEASMPGVPPASMPPSPPLPPPGPAATQPSPPEELPLGQPLK